jgi:hypothetical protein
MEFNPVMITVAGVILLVLGVGAGWLLGSVGEENDPEPGITDPAPPGGRKGKYTPVARLWRERKAGTLVVEMDGKSFVAVDGLDEVQRDRLEKTARELRAFLGMGLAAADESAPVAPAEPPTAQRVAAASVGAASAGAVSYAVPAASAATPPAATPPAPTWMAGLAQPAPSSAPVPRPVVRSKPPVVGKEELVAPLAAKSIVMQIEDILQDMIAGTPLATRGLHLTEDPVRGVIVQLGLQFFEGIDAVTDPEAKAAIRAAVKEWETLR